MLLETRLPDTFKSVVNDVFDNVVPEPLEVSVCVPNLILDPLNHKSLHAFVALPKSCVIFSAGIKSPVTTPPD